MDGNDECGPFVNNVLVKHPRYLSYDERERSFKNFPFPCMVQDLVASGFSYTGRGDVAICFLCGLGSENRSQGGKPWITHATWNPRCFHVISCRSNNIDRKKTIAKNICERCWVRAMDALTLPCHHLVTCTKCIDRLVFCIVCCTTIESVINVFYSKKC